MNTKCLFSSLTVTVSDFWCEPGPLLDSELEIEPEFGVSFPRAGVYVHRTPGGTLVVDPTVAVFRTAGEEQITSHPTDQGDCNTELQFAPEMVAPLLDSHDRFRLRTAPISEQLTARHRRLLRRLYCGRDTNPLEVEEEALSLLRLAHRLEPIVKVTAHQRRLVDEARQYIAERFREDLDLASVATAVGASPFHLSRVFKKALGRSLTEYRTALRVRFAIDRIAEGADDLSRLAVEAGFYDHSHMTNTFRRRLGSPPSELRNWLAT